MISPLSDEDIIHNIRNLTDGAEWLTRYMNLHWKAAAFKVLFQEGASIEEASHLFEPAIAALYYNIAENAFKGESKLQVYFIGICKKLLAKKIRENIRDRNKDPEEEAANHQHPHFELEQAQLPEILDKCFDELAEPCRSIERLKLEGWGLEAIARYLGMTLRQVKGISAECREKLIERLKKYGYGRSKR